MTTIKAGDGDNEGDDNLTIVAVVALAVFLSRVHVFTLAQMERDRRRGRTPAERGTLAPQPDTTRARTPATAGRTRQQ